MLNKDFYRELAIESKMIEEFHSLSLSGKEIMATLILDELEKNGIAAPVFVASYTLAVFISHRVALGLTPIRTDA